MSALGYIYGCIVGGGILGSPESPPFYIHNQKIIQNLPKEPDLKKGLLVSSSMFTVPMFDDLSILFYRSQIIHFGLSVNHLHAYWKDWLEQFEDVLRKLYWHEAYAYLTAEMYAENDKYYWKADISPVFENPPRPIEKWEFLGELREFKNW